MSVCMRKHTVWKWLVLPDECARRFSTPISGAWKSIQKLLSRNVLLCILIDTYSLYSMGLQVSERSGIHLALTACWKNLHLPFDRFRANGGLIEMTDIIPFVVSLSNHSKHFSNSLLKTALNKTEEAANKSPSTAMFWRQIKKVRRRDGDQLSSGQKADDQRSGRLYFTRRSQHAAGLYMGYTQSRWNERMSCMPKIMKSAASLLFFVLL